MADSAKVRGPRTGEAHDVCSNNQA